MKHYKISILLPTRGRTSALKRSLKSLLTKASSVDHLELRLGFDEDDQDSIDYFANELQPWLDEVGIDYHALVFTPLGYGRLNEYVNGLAANTACDWFFFWNDDAVMDTQDWDQTIIGHTGEFKLLAVRTHNDHPYSIFPIVPRAWYDTLGHLSQHQMNDAWLTQIAYKLDVYERIPVWVTHDRLDLTGNNNDLTYKARVMYEGNPNDPRDFHHKDVIQRRMTETEQLATYMRSQGVNTDFWERVKAGTQDPWEKLKANDVNNQMKQFKIDQNNRMVEKESQLYDFNYFTRADGIVSWKSKSLKFGDALAAMSYAYGLTWDELVSAFKPAFEHDPNGRAESTDKSVVQEQMKFLQTQGRRTPKRVLEIGGGRGEVATVLKRMGVDVVSVELGPEAEKWYAGTAYHYFGDGMVPVVPVNKPIQDAMSDIDLSTFDTILMVESLEHIPAGAFEPVWQAIKTQFKGRFIVVNWPDYHPIWIGRDAGPEEHCRLVDDALYDAWSAEAQSVYTRQGSHLALDF
jgi:2-polyprenyl-3-methyl-5-hydroxy-6-metoxy-1,4-benzoquinol methylase